MRKCLSRSSRAAEPTLQNSVMRAVEQQEFAPVRDVAEVQRMQRQQRLPEQVPQQRAAAALRPERPPPRARL